MSSTPATTIRQRLQNLRPEVLAVARRHGASSFEAINCLIVLFSRIHLHQHAY